MMFDNFVWSFLLKQSIHIEISTEYTFIVHLQVDNKINKINNQNIFRNAFIELINTYWFSKSRNVISLTVVDLTSTISKGCEPTLVDFSRLSHLPLAREKTHIRKHTDRTLDVVFSRFRVLSFTITLLRACHVEYDTERDLA